MSREVFSLLIGAWLASAGPALAADAELESWQAALEAVRPVVAEVRGLEWRRELKVEMRDADPADPWLARISGYYRWGSDTVTIIRGQPGTDPFTRRLLLAHELAHALQDQHWHDALEADPPGGDRDARLAREAAVEGEAHLVAIAFALRELRLDRLLRAEDVPALGRLATLAYEAGRLARGYPRDRPPADRDERAFPYTEGLGFAQAVVRARGGGLGALDGVLADPPRSTEEVLHPEKYLAAAPEPPAELAVPPPPEGEGWRLVAAVVEGEWRIRGALRERGLSRRAAARAAAGWAGDRRAVYRRGPDYAWVWEIACDSERDADELAAAWRKAPQGAGLPRLAGVSRNHNARIELRFDLPGAAPREPSLF